MNTSIIKKETNEQIIEPPVKLSRRIPACITDRKNDLVSMLREENDTLYQEYLNVIKRNVELRAIVEKQQKVINAIYNAELNIILPADENIPKEPKTPVMEQQNMVQVIEQPVPGVAPVEVAETESSAAEIPLPERQAAEPPVPVVMPPEPLPVDKLAKRLFRLRRKKWQSKPSLTEKAKCLLLLYNESQNTGVHELIAACGITKITVMRYVRFFRKFSLINDYNYRLTDAGKKFVEGKPGPEWDKYSLSKNWSNIQ